MRDLDADREWGTLIVLKALRQHSEGECLGFSDGVGGSYSVSNHARQLGNLGDPATVVLYLVLHSKSHAYLLCDQV
jgi:hypothetical protein